MVTNFDARVLAVKAKLSQAYIELCALSDEADSKGLHTKAATIGQACDFLDKSELALVSFT